MKQKHVLIEISIVGLILIILSGVMFPKFLQSQRTGEPRQLINNLQLLVEGIKAYQMDYDGVPAAIVEPMDAALQVMRPLQIDISQGYYYHQNYNPFQFLYEKGYLDSMPNFTLVDNFLESGVQNYARHSTEMSIQLRGKSIQSKKGFQTLEQFYACQFWFNAEPDDINQFIDNFGGKYNPSLWRISSPVQFESDGIWMNEQAFYSPTNGLYSAGILYADSSGKHSPWE